MSSLSYEDYRILRESFFELAKGYRNMCFENKHHHVTFNGWLERGLVIHLEKYSDPYTHLMRVKINPAKVLGDTDAITLFTPTHENIEALVNSMSRIFELLPIELPVTSLSLTRVDLCKNISVPSQEIISEYLRLLKRGAKRKNWRADHFGDERDDHSFRLSNSRYQITVYDKLYQVQDRGLTTSWHSPNKILRIEVSLLPDGICHMGQKLDCHAESWDEEFLFLAEHGDWIMPKVLGKAILPGDYYCLSTARRRIEEQAHIGLNTQALIRFLKAINDSSRVDPKSIKSHPNGKNRLKQLLSLGINPVTIESRAGIDYLPSLLSSDFVIL